ncbi:increased DNA methylation 3-like isoform X2 [Diospyros lotus]|nr:increased DNA methylation 3-like isoform X2 [Diospyros lotus]
MGTEACAAPEEFNPCVVLTGTAKEGSCGPTLGLMDIGVSPKAYLCRIALPGIRKDESKLAVDIQREGKVTVRGMSPSGRLLKDSSTVHVVRVQQLSPPGEFSISFNLPGPVDPRLVSPNFRLDGILELVIMKVMPTA